MRRGTSSLRVSLAGVIALAWLAAASSVAGAADKPMRFVRFQAGNAVSYGIVEGEQVRAIDAAPFADWNPTDQVYPLDSVKLLAPVERPSQILALAGSYKSHLGGGDLVTTVVTTTKVTTRGADGQHSSDSKTTVEVEKPGEVPAKFQIPQFFFKSPSCLVGPGDNVVIPRGTNEVHFEAELVIVIGRKAKNVSADDARACILGVTCGNDISARDWQRSDVQWWRAKGSDTFGPLGPVIVSGLDYNNLKLQLRQNGKVMQQASTSELIHNVGETVSVASRYITLHPGDLIFTGTPGKTSAIKPGDKLEVEIEGIGTLANPVVAAGD